MSVGTLNIIYLQSSKKVCLRCPVGFEYAYFTQLYAYAVLTTIPAHHMASREAHSILSVIFSKNTGWRSKGAFTLPVNLPVPGKTSW